MQYPTVEAGTLLMARSRIQKSGGESLVVNSCPYAKVH